MKNKNQEAAVDVSVNSGASTGLKCEDPSLTKQAFTDECDINKIMARVVAGGGISHLNTRAPLYGDFTQIPDYRESLDMINEAQEAFMSLDWKVRERFGNDPGKLLDFLSDPQNHEEGVKLGILKPKPSEKKSVGEEPGAPPGKAPEGSS